MVRGAPVVLVACALVPACGRAALPDPRGAAKAWGDAVERGDADAARALLDERSRARLAPADVKRLLADERQELATQARATEAAASAAKISAEVRFADGEHSTLVWERGAFRVASADALPAGARTPAQALEQLRRVLARRSFAGLLRVLTPTTRAALEGDLRSLVDGLAHPEGLDVKVSGDVASVQVGGGHQVRLRRDAGVWHVEDFD